MKTRSWILLLSLILVICGILSFFLLSGGQAASTAAIYSDGVLVKTVSLLEDDQFTVTAPGGGSNTITIENGRIAVTQATCPDHHCLHRGFCRKGPPIICLPNRLEIRFLAPDPVDIPLG